MNNYFTNVNLLKIIWKWKWHLSIIALITIILSVIFSSPIFITPKFKSVAILYPSSIQTFSEENQTEQMLQWLYSREIKDSVIKEFELDKHYNIDTGYRYYYTTLLREYKSNVSIKKTEYESIEIEVLDKDPVIAYKMVNAIINYYNKLVEHETRRKYKENLDIAEKAFLDKANELDSIENKLEILNQKYHIIDYANQTREITRGYLRTIEGSNKQNINYDAILKQKKNIELKGADFIKHNKLYYNMIDQYSHFLQIYQAAQRNYNKHISYYTMVTKPFVADKKTTPVRWIIVLGSIIIAEFLALIIIFLLENTKNQQA